MQDKIIIVEGNRKYVFSNKKVVVEQFLGKDYYQLSEKEQYERVRLRTIMNSTLKGIPAIDLKKGQTVEEIEKAQYVILDEETFLLSLAKNNDVVIYEQENANEFASSDIDKTKLERIAKQYIRINDCANEAIANKLQTLNLEVKPQGEEQESDGRE